MNPLADEDGNSKVEADTLNMGIFVVKSKSQRGVGFEEGSKRVKDDKELKIILFLCKTERDRSQLNTAGFVICGKYLCWSYAAEKVVHTLNMDGMNSTGIEEATKTAGRAINKAFNNILGGLSGGLGAPGGLQALTALSKPIPT